MKTFSYADPKRINKIALISSKEHSRKDEIVSCAISRSFGMAQNVSSHISAASPYSGIITTHPNDDIIGLFDQGRKILLLGHLGPKTAKALGVSIQPDISKSVGLWALNQEKTCDISKGRISYDLSHELGRHSPYRNRYLLRYDYEREWNNHGYGGIFERDPDFGVAFGAKAAGKIQPVAWLTDQSGNNQCLYAGLMDFPDASVLWFNRPVGPLDSLEWCIVEAFFSEYRADDLACFPYLSDIPYGYDGAVSMHADCDEAIATADELFDLYRKHDIPFSLAVKTGQEISSEDLSFMRKVLESGGCISSHSCHHFENWGGAFETAFREAADSKRWLESQVTDGEPVRYAVSPFYQNPPYAVQALAKAGFQGFVGGIICNDPEYLIGRSGVVPLCNAQMVSHSQQCMLHGDCYHRYGNTISPYIEAFDTHRRAGSFFGYLDHPFSQRYSYGWYDENERLEAHTELIVHMENSGRIWFANLDQCLDFVRKKSAASVWIDENGTLQSSGFHDRRLSLPDLAVSFRGKITRIGFSNEELRQ